MDTERLLSIAAMYRDLDPLEAYYRKRNLDHQTMGPFPFWANDLVVASLGSVGEVLDVGCGDGRTLVENHSLFRRGAGIDGSERVIEKARDYALEKSASNVEFTCAKAVALPYGDGSFDLVYSERGPLGHADCTLEEALRVLRPNGRILIETMGSHHMREYPKDCGYTHEGTLLTSLDIERDRLERFGVQPMHLSSVLYTLRFGSEENWFEYHCSVQRYLGQKVPDSDDMDMIGRMITGVMNDTGSLSLTHHQILIGGVKSG